MSSFDDYLASVPEPQKSELERILRLVRSVVPEAEEATSYGMLPDAALDQLLRHRLREIERA